MGLPIENVQAPDLLEYNELIKSRDRWRGAAAVSFGAGVLCGVTGFFLYAFDNPTIEAPARRQGPTPKEPEPDSKPETSTMEVAAMPAYVPGGALVLLGGTF